MATHRMGRFFTGMNRTKIAGLALAGTVIGVAAPAGAAVITFSGATGGEWSDPLNWDLGRVPNDTDSVHLSGKTVNLSAIDAHIEQFASGSNGTLNINDGGSLTGDHNYTVRYVSLINVNDGGELVMAPSWTIRSNIMVNEGGTVTGAASTSINEERRITVNGIWSPRGTVASDGTDFRVGGTSTSGNPPVTNQRPGDVVLGSTGSIILDLYGDAFNEYFNVEGLTAATELTLDVGTIELRPQEGYVPVIGHSFDLWDLAEDSLATMTIGDGTNIVLPGYELDLSQWTSEGIVTVSGGGAAVPEPASLAVLGLGALAMLRRRR